MANSLQLSQFTHIALNGEDINDSENDEEPSLCEEDILTGQISDQNDVHIRTLSKSPPGSDVNVGSSRVNGNGIDVTNASSVDDAFAWVVNQSNRDVTSPFSKSPPSFQEVEHQKLKKQGDNCRQDDNRVSAESSYPSLLNTTSIKSVISGGHSTLRSGFDSQKKRQMAWRGPRHTSGGSNGSSEGYGQNDNRSIDGLLFEIYDRWQRDSFDSDTFTECSSTSDAFQGRVDSVHHDLEEKHGSRLSRATLLNKGNEKIVS